MMGWVPLKFRQTFLLRMFGFFKIPMLLFVSPSVLELSDQRCVVRVPLSWRTRNHLNSMYFGALAVGADCAGGLMVTHFIQQTKSSISLIFKDFHADYLKRAEGDVVFSCEQGSDVKEFVYQVLQTGERKNFPLRIVATVPTHFGDEPVAYFLLTVSLKKKT